MHKPCLLYADDEGNIYDWPGLEMAGRSGWQYRRLKEKDWMPLPPGSELFALPRRLPLGWNAARKRFQTLLEDPRNPRKTLRAVAAFVAPAHTQIYSAAYQTQEDAPLLPLFAYTAVGWKDGAFVAACMRTDPDERQDHKNFNPGTIERNARRRMRLESSNRLLVHLGKCALTFACPAARNLFMNRWEAPLPSSPVCNARCLGCISLQEREDLCATQDRIAFVPTPDEICGVAVPHLQKARRAVVSFGQGCEGEPLLQGETLARAIKMMRESTSRGTINLNTNGSLPGTVEHLCQSGLDSIRVSLNSARPDFYHAYFKPRGYSFEDVCESIKRVKKAGGFASINYFVLPGFTDTEEEFHALAALLEKTGLDLIQMRNLNMDPEWYLKEMAQAEKSRPLGIRRLARKISKSFPHVRLGYFNPCLDPHA